MCCTVWDPYVIPVQGVSTLGRWLADGLSSLLGEAAPRGANSSDALRATHYRLTARRSAMGPATLYQNFRASFNAEFLCIEGFVSGTCKRKRGCQKAKV